MITSAVMQMRTGTAVKKNFSSFAKLMQQLLVMPLLAHRTEGPVKTYLGPGAELHDEGHLVQMRKPLQEHHRRLNCL